MSDPTLTRETLAKAMSRKPVEGCSKGPWRANIYLGGAYAIDRVAPNGDVLTRIAVADGAMETRANGELLAMALDLQDETQVLQVTVRQLELAAIAFRDLNMCYRIDKRPTEALFRRLDKAKATLALMPTEGESDELG